MAGQWRQRQLCVLVLLSAGIYVFLLNQFTDSIRMWTTRNAATTILVLTPTYPRPTQIADMTRLCNTLMHIPALFWVVVEDAYNKTENIAELLEFCSVPFVHLAKRTPRNLTGPYKGRGVTNRNEGLRWIRENVHTVVSDNRSAVVYFADDDNAYDIRLFEEIRKTDPNRVSMFPVGTIAGTGVSSPIIDQDGSLLGFFDPYPAKRKYMVDMAGFAVGLEILLRSGAKFVYRTGALEDYFLRDLHFQEEDIQFLADRCTRILAWHVKTSGGPFIKLITLADKLKPFVNNTNLFELVRLYSPVPR
ncbi:galactosylgalactosylxylosylprotein 3-beta-glucuronosyltransferase P-like [Varroa jacobsoni]|uniref:galactosylgalactosylxylosylprotein 3-beta-glucuronosyltransferase P-like n=1 Tax=Varroa jacobsoni TaxID=62625 RepID=UPI000BF6BEA8|nr:galactosylgalactosylxylosylprotein 3-beta-glucuronosyltransferase P-like [Varroa jacobsoni]XP_022695908.1 galactosylgalactosylxylosylprotein 3-beta-glucuronosyltransferase P-like [Varroa jacobsoni]XP_022695909.1 galactosylgalactosylxylosylprotein 3-beta-glucuronosyltransferase P-like [Varroa jacobsoni]XP_022695910.1 galactosylgalactosylxylosylprotein 3-beta-glucuronosyltransferase P-like [Varroa jacobsoni]XP_022695911.1 galactosylgalactosylxylosylprotein 3-beta-glucuronosyltransferase P-like